MDKLMRGEIPNPRTDSVGPGHMSAQEMDQRMTALVEKFENAPPELRQCSACGRFALAFGSLWLDGQGWIPMQGCLACRRMFVEVRYDTAGDVQVHEVRDQHDVYEHGQARRTLNLPAMPEEGRG